MRRRAAAVTSLTACSNAASFTRDGRVVPLSLRTNCSAEAWISSLLAGGSKFASVLILRHMSSSSSDFALRRRGGVRAAPVAQILGDLVSLAIHRPVERSAVVHVVAQVEARATFDERLHDVEVAPPHRLVQRRRMR